MNRPSASSGRGLVVARHLLDQARTSPAPGGDLGLGVDEARFGSIGKALRRITRRESETNAVECVYPGRDAARHATSGRYEFSVQGPQHSAAHDSVLHKANLAMAHRRDHRRMARTGGSGIGAERPSTCAAI